MKKILTMTIMMKIFKFEIIKDNEGQEGDDGGEEQNDNDEGELGDKEDDKQRYIKHFLKWPQCPIFES